MKKPFTTLGPSAFIEQTREYLLKNADLNVWRFGGESSLTAIHLPTTRVIRNRYSKTLVAQIWLERPKKGYARCKFEIASSTPAIRVIREKIADSLRACMLKAGLPQDIEEAAHSTVVATRIFLSRIIGIGDDVSKNVDHEEINKIVRFCKYLESVLREWNRTNAIELVDTFD